MYRTSVGRILLGIASVSVGGCGTTTETVCTAQFVAVTVVVSSPTGEPVTGANLVVTVTRTGQQLTPQGLILYTTGTYPLIDDGSRQAIRQSGEELRARISKGGTSVEAVFRVDVPGGCHVRKIAGPDTVVLQ